MCKKPTDGSKLIFTQQTLFGRLYIGFGCLLIILWVLEYFFVKDGVNYYGDVGLVFIVLGLSQLTVEIRFYPHHFAIVRGPWSGLLCCCNFRPTFGKIIVPYSHILAVRELPQSCIYFTPISSFCSIKQNVVKITIVPQYQGSYEDSVLTFCFYPKVGKFGGEGGCCFNTCGANCCLVNTTNNYNSIEEELKKRQSESNEDDVQKIVKAEHDKEDENEVDIGVELVVAENSKETILIQ
eukprot:102680_1